jgi:hypothetical protein
MKKITPSTDGALPAWRRDARSTRCGGCGYTTSESRTCCWCGARQSHSYSPPFGR